MKRLFILAVLVSTNLLAKTSVPFYFGVTEGSMSKLPDTSWEKISIKEVETDKVYLRGYSFLDKNILTDGSTKKSSLAVVAAKKKTREAAVKELLKKGVLKSGDIVLSFRREWEGTTAYPQVQMGVSHAGVVFVENGQAFNIDMPLDPDYNNSLINSNLTSPHYLEADSLHIVRPRSFGTEKQKNLLSWINTIRTNYAAIRNGGLLKFNSNYMDAKYDKYGSKDAFVTTMGRVITGENKTAKDLTMFCSEFAWALLSLSSCKPSDLATDKSANAACVQDIMKPLPMVASATLPGLTEGPLAVLDALDISLSQKTELSKTLLGDGAIASLSAGHRALATDPNIQKLIGVLRLIYPAKLSGSTVVPFPAPNTPISALSAQINAEAGLNYSPTSYLINAMLDEQDPERKFDYVATILFTDKL